MIKRIKACRLFITLFLLNLPVIASSNGAPHLLLATSWETGSNPSGWWLSEKFDGVRGYWTGSQMLSRKGNPIVLPKHIHAQLPPFALDGELWLGRNRFSETLSIVRDQVPGKGWSDIQYLIFDAPGQTGPFEARLAVVESWLKHHPSSNMKLIEQIRCRDGNQLELFMDAIEAKGGEGVMLRAPNSPYQIGRSEFLKKYKRFDDTEATVIGYKPGKGKYQGMVGSLQVSLSDGTRFFVGSGLSDDERKSPPPIGAVIAIRHHGWTRHGKPRFPSYWRVRD